MRGVSRALAYNVQHRQMYRRCHQVSENEYSSIRHKTNSGQRMQEVRMKHCVGDKSSVEILQGHMQQRGAISRRHRAFTDTPQQDTSRIPHNHTRAGLEGGKGVDQVTLHNHHIGHGAASSKSRRGGRGNDTMSWQHEGADYTRYRGENNNTHACVGSRSECGCRWPK